MPAIFAIPDSLIVKTKAEILALAASSGLLAYASDTYEMFVADGSAWRVVPFALVAEGANPDMGYVQGSSRIGYGTDYITDKAISNSRILENALTQEGAIRTTTAGLFQVYLNAKWNTVVVGFTLRENATYGYTFEHQPVGFTNYIEIMSGNSTNNLGLNGLPITQGYVTSMGAYPTPPIIYGGTF